MKSISFRFFISNLKISLVLSVTVLLLLSAGFLLLIQPTTRTASSIESTDFSVLQKMKPIAVKATKPAALGDTGDLKNSNWFATIQKEMSKSEYFIRKDASSGALGSPNRKNNLRFTYDANGFSVQPRTTKIPLKDLKPEQDSDASEYKTIEDWAIRFDHNNSQWGEGYWKINDNKAEYVTDKVTVQYDNQEEGMRQNFVVKAPLEKGKKLSIGFKVTSSLQVNVNQSALDFSLNGEQVMQYNDLKVWDANGKTLTASLQFNGKEAYSIEVDDSKAVYPITIDPISTTVAAMVESNQANARMGSSVSGAGDVNGDGYSDVIVGVENYDNGQSDEGVAYVYHGNSSGISTTAAAMVQSNVANGYMGRSVSGAGDVNGDGYGDVIVGGHGYTNGESNEGAAFIYHGSASGINTTEARKLESNQANAEMGASVSGAGDVNGDGYSDVIVAMRYYDNGQTNEGAARVYHGSSTGISNTAAAMVESNQADANLGFSVAGAGDVNNDGYSDVIVGANDYDNGSSNEGAAFVYHGSSTGISTTAAARVESNQVNARMGWSVSGAGDVNNDGYSDVIVGAAYYDNGNSDEGAAFVYHGSSTGISTTESARVESNRTNAWMGYSVAGVGDINGDGYKDVVVGARYYANGENDEGAVYFYHGSSTGINTTAVTVIESNQANAEMGTGVSGAGDVNGDGYSDVIFGVQNYDNGETNEGAAFVFHGGATGISTAATNRANAASSTPTLCINTALTNITHTTAGATGISNDNVAGVNGLPAGVKANWATNLITISGTPTASGTFNYSIPLTGGSGSVNATGTITVTAASVSGTISGGGTVTSGTNSTTLTLSGYTGSIQWQSSTNNASYSNIGGATSSTYTATNLTTSTFYKAVVTNGTCASSTSSNATITVASSSTVFNITGTGTANTISNNVASVVDPNIVVTANGTVNGFTVTITGDYTTGDILGYTGSLPYGVTASAFNTTTRSLSFTGTASAADWQTLLRTVTLTSPSSCYATNRKVSFLPSIKNFNYFNGHYYEYISTASTWTAAKADAESRSFFGRQGYLVTISSEAENNYIWKLIGNNSWIGLSCAHTEINAALGYTKYGSTTYGQFYWVTGPEKGTLVSTGLNSPVAASGVYTHWITGEPNNYLGVGENSGHMYSSGSSGGNASFWNDFPSTNVISYIVEYGGMQGDDESSTISFTRNIIISGSPSGTVTGDATVCSGTNSTTLTYGGTGTIQRWEYSTDNFVTTGTTVSSTSSTLTVNNLSSSRYYRAVVNASGCTNLASSSALITVTTSIAGTITSTSADVCAGGSTALTLNGNSGDIQKWQVSTSSNFTTGVTDISNTTNSLSYTLSTNGTYYFRASVLNSACVGGTPVYTVGYPVTVTTGTAPVGGTVSSASFCGGSNSGTLTLTGSTGTSYQWQISTDGGVAYTNASSTSTIQSYSGITSTTKYRVLVTNGSCGTATSSVGTVAVGIAYVENTITLSTAANTAAQTITVNNQPISNIRYVTTGASGASFSGLPSGVSGTWSNDMVNISGTTTTNGTYNYTVTLTGGCGTTTVTATGTITVNIPYNTWTGTTNNLWNVATNWSLGTVPTSSETFTITTGAPQLNVDFTLSGNLTISGTGTLIVNAGKTLSVASGGTADFGGQSVTFKSDATGTAQLGSVLGTLSNASNVTMERYIPARRGYRLLASPVTTTTSIKYNWMENATTGSTAGYPYAAGTAVNPIAGYGTHITGTGTGFDATQTGNSSLFGFNTSSQTWSALTSTAGVFTAGDAYRLQVRGDRSIDLNTNTPTPNNTILRATGTPKTGNHTVTGSLAQWGWTLVGNPYQSTVNMVSVKANSTNIRNYYYVWDPTLATRGAYVTYDFSLMTPNVTSNVNQYLQPGQAMLIQTDIAGATSILFRESDKSTASNQTATFQTAVVYPMLNVSLNYTDSLARNAAAMDGFKVAFSSSFNNAVDNSDAQKLPNLDENLSIIRDANYLSIEKRNLYNATTEIPVSISNYIRQQYTLRISWSNPSDNSFVAQLKDGYTNTLTPINFSGNTDYSYTIDNSIAASKAHDRFKIVFVPNAALPVSGLILTGASKGNAIVLQYEALNEREMQGYAIERSADGTVFTKLGEQPPVNGLAASNRYNYTDNNPLAGVSYYRIKGSSVNGQLQYSNIITVKTGSMMPLVTVAPNPVVGKVLNLKLSQLTKGSYKMIVSDVAGRTIFSKEMVYDGVNAIIKTTLPSAFKTGNYYVRLSGEGIDFTEKFIIQ
ncbi:MAG: FG-GAP-like repeat-containing protein [Chitinophagaceae bacterium]|nr:FG-GAP-like repeat-containing protein [Chitinophagaceae bacterium]